MAFAALSFAAVSCVEEEVHKPGEADADGCYGVYFPAQESALTLDPAEPLTATIAVVRTVSTEEITVPVKLTDETGIFAISELKFEDGQTESTIEVTFENAEVGVKYACALAIEDPQYASKYSSNPVYLDFSVVREKWNDLGKGTYADKAGLWKSFTKEVTILQNDLNKNLFRLVMIAGPEEYIYTDKSPANLELKVLKKGDTLFDGEVKIEEDDLVVYNPFDTGFLESSYNDNIWMYHPAWFNNMSLSHNRVLQYQPDGTPAGIQLAPMFYLPNAGAGSNQTEVDGVIVITFPGAVLTDYSLKIETGLAEEGELPVQFTLGPDVASAKYAVYEGQLNSAQKQKFAEAIGAGTETAAKDVPEGGLFSVTLEKTGVYTIIGVTFDAEGKPQESEVAEFSYLAQDDTKPVTVSAGMVATGKYGENNSSDNTLEYYVYGKDIVEAKIELFTTDELEAKYDDCVKALMKTKSLSDEELAKINSAESLVGIFTDRAPGTSYTMLVWASNGYEAKVIAVTAKTTGKLEVTLEEMLGTYAVNGTSYFNGPLEKPETWIIEASDNSEKGNIMLTAFASLRCQNPIYATVDTDLNIISIPDYQFFMAIEAQDWNMYFANGNSANPITFNIIGKGKFSGPSELFGIYIEKISDGSELGYYDAYTSISAVKVVKEDEPAAPALKNSIYTGALTGTATPNRRIVMMNAEREVKAAEFTVGSAEPFKAEKNFIRVDRLF